MSRFGAQVGRSIAWSGAGSMVLRFGQLLAGILVARLLTPHDFGAFAVTLAVYVIVVNISELGVGSALIRQRDGLDATAPTAVTFSLVSSAVLAGGMWLVAPMTAELLGAAEATGAIRVMALVVLLAGPSAVPAALLTREFRQDRRFAADLTNFLVSTGVLILLAVNGGGVLALAWSRVAGQLVSVVLLLVLSPVRYRPGFRRVEAVRLFRFGVPLVGANLVGYSLGNVDVVTLGRVSGAGTLGSYTLANNVAGWPLGLFSSVLTSVGLPVLSQVRGDVRVLTRYLANAMSTVCAVFFLITAMCAGLAQNLVDALYGPQWHAAGPVLAVLALYGSVRVVLALLSDALVACNSPRSLFGIQVTWLVVLVPVMIVAVHLRDAVGAATAQVVVSALVVVPLTLLALRRVAGVPVRPLLGAAVRPLLAAVPAGLVAHLSARALDSAWGGLLVGGVVGTLVYLALLGRWSLRLVTEIRAVYGDAPVAEAEVPPGLVAAQRTD
ncbi:hypothetical protein AGMMS50218_09790 [Actinomycetota bacterium]|nr:hypothetical protein AGMMS50218_09790 [Actinomycetota bacterium]